MKPDDTGALALRACRPSDVDEVLRLWRESRTEPAATSDERRLAALLVRDHGAVLVAELDGRVVGSLIAAWDGWRGNMYRLAVHPSYRRRGIALRLVQEGEERLRAKGADRVTALVWRAEARAVYCWLSAGYEDEEGTGRFVKTIAG